LKSKVHSLGASPPFSTASMIGFLKIFSSRTTQAYLPGRAAQRPQRRQRLASASGTRSRAGRPRTSATSCRTIPRSSPPRWCGCSHRTNCERLVDPSRHLRFCPRSERGDRLCDRVIGATTSRTLTRPLPVRSGHGRRTTGVGVEHQRVTSGRADRPALHRGGAGV
jgi:hypothetical protein